MDERLVPVFPLRVVLYPGMVLPLKVFEARYLQMLGDRQSGEQDFCAALIRSGDEVGGTADPYRVGCLAHISAVEQTPEGILSLVTVGQERLRLTALDHSRPYLMASVERIPEETGDPERLAAQTAQARELLAAVVGRLQKLRVEEGVELTLPDDPRRLSYAVAAAMGFPQRDKQALLEAVSDLVRLELLTVLLRRELQVLRWYQRRPEPSKEDRYSLN